MATRGQIGRLAQRIDQIAGDLASRRPMVVAQIIHDPEIDATEEAAFERHFADHPEDRDATHFIVCKIIDPKRQGHGHPSKD